MPEGTPIIAARGGVVVKIENSRPGAATTVGQFRAGAAR
jgi:murein DD-endopeptidase MepM/ murein hydrolase activator NlpD